MKFIDVPHVLITDSLLLVVSSQLNVKPRPKNSEILCFTHISQLDTINLAEFSWKTV